MTEELEAIEQESKPGNWKRVVLIVVGILILMSCCTAAVFFGAKMFTGVVQEGTAVGEVLQDFMVYMERKDTTQAEKLFSSRALRQMGENDLDEMLEGFNYALFDGFLNLEISQLNIKKAVNSNPNLPQGTIAEITGVVNYEKGYKGKIEAVLEKENGIWKIHMINVTVSPEKFEDFSEKLGRVEGPPYS